MSFELIGQVCVGGARVMACIVASVVVWLRKSPTWALAMAHATHDATVLRVVDKVRELRRGSFSMERDVLPLDVFVEIAAGLWLVPDPDFDLDAAIGGRYWF